MVCNSSMNESNNWAHFITFPLQKNVRYDHRHDQTTFYRNYNLNPLIAMYKTVHKQYTHNHHVPNVQIKGYVLYKLYVANKVFCRFQ